MKRVAETVLVVCLLMMTSFLHQTTAAPSWRPQGRFGKRGITSSFAAGGLRKHYWRPQGRYGKRSGDFLGDRVDKFMAQEGVKAPALSGEIEFPVEAILSRDRVDTVRMVAKLCTLTGLSGFAPCSWSTEHSPETY